jgi:uncharacterized RDD family membrane protein YckC
VEDSVSDAPNNPPGGQAPPPQGGQAPPPGQQPQPPQGGQAPPPGQQPQPPQGGQAPPPQGQAPAPAGGQPAANTAGQPGDLGTRILAKVIDSIIVGIVVGPLWAAISIGLAVAGLPCFFTRLLTYTMAAALYVGYFAFMESNKGQTVGKMLMKLEVRGPNGGHPTMEEAVKRNAYFGVLLIGIIPFVGWFLYPLAYLGAVIYLIVTINNNEQTRQGWHDDLAGGTWVLKTA